MRRRRRPGERGWTVTAAEWLVVAAGIAAIVWVNWYFFFAERTMAESGAAAEPGAVRQQQ